MYYTDDMVSNGLYLTWIYAYIYSPEYNLKQANCVSYLSGHHDKTFEGREVCFGLDVRGNNQSLWRRHGS